MSSAFRSMSVKRPSFSMIEWRWDTPVLLRGDFSDVRYAMEHLFATTSAPSPPLSAMSRRCLVFLWFLILYTAAKLGSALLTQLAETTSRDAEQKKRN
jgi:hypothetical protein